MNIIFFKNIYLYLIIKLNMNYILIMINKKYKIYICKIFRNNIFKIINNEE
jgi:hypothetical protein